MATFQRPERRSKSGQDGGEWLSVSDLMAGLMMIFLFIAIVYIRPLLETQNKIRDVTEDWVDVRADIYEALRSEFADDLARWDAELERDTLTIRFRAPDIMFESGKADLRPEFEAIMDSFFPRYLNVLAPFERDIEEVRIEGHTSSAWFGETGPTAYFGNLDLSQQRTRAVLAYGFRDPAAFEAQAWARNKMTANGLSSSRLVLDADGVEDARRSRRVEFRVRTNAAARIDQIVDNLR